MSRLLLTSLCGAAFALTVPATAHAAYKAEYKLSTVLGNAFPWGQGAERWAQLVKERTGGRINIKVYPGAALVNGDQTRELTSMRQGGIDMAVGSTINWSPQIRQLNLFALPFLLPDYAALDALTQGRVGTELFGVMEKAGIVPLAWGENGFRELSNSKREIRNPADLKGLKIRIVGSPIFNETFSTLGANPTQMSWADAQPAMASGAVDGQENPLSLFSAAKLNTVGQKYLTLWGYMADPLVFAVNRKVWASWSPADQKIVAQAARDAAREQIKLARAGISGQDNATLRAIGAQGVKVTALTPAEKATFARAARPVYDKWAQRVGTGLVKQAETDIAKRKQ
ncbi:DctP family TRAP transporter solute-binding subunit [Crenobacter caeni]|uniref:DctP family TRAP transporter solute-binding subunit n=1 Tax=Crenobacter caeni TaxID=2705474 RepID=UPI00193EC846